MKPFSPVVPGRAAKAARELRHLKQYEVANALRVHPSVVTRFEKLDRIPPQYVPKLDKLFGGTGWRADPNAPHPRHNPAGLAQHYRDIKGGEQLLGEPDPRIEILDEGLAELREKVEALTEAVEKLLGKRLPHAKG